MSLIVVAVGVMLLTVPALAAHSSIGPPAQVRTSCIAAASGMWILGTGILLTASPLLLRWHAGPETARLAHLSPGGPWVWAAGGLVGGLGASGVIAAMRQTIRSRRRAALPRWAADSFSHDEYAGAEVRVAPTLEPVAFAVPGRDSHVVISRAVTGLPGPEQRAVLAHEGAHLRLRHDRHLLVLALYERVWGWLPGVRAVADRHRYSVELWADMVAARSPLVDQAACDRARAALHLCTDGVAIAKRTHSRTHSPARQLSGVTAIIAALIVAGAYSATHTFADLNAAFAALH